MPAKSVAQRRFMAMCEHGVGTNKACPDMTKKQFHDFAVTKEKNLPKHVKKSVRGSGTFSDSEIKVGYRRC